MNPKKKRVRGFILSRQGWQKVQNAKTEWQFEEKQGYQVTLEEIGERAGLTTATIRKILTRDEGVDKRSLATLFASLDLELTADDCTRPDPQKKLDSKQNPRKVDWGEAVDVSFFYGRTQELATLDRWLLEDRCRLITIIGMGGIGKTSLSVKLTQQVENEFDCIMWRSLRDAPPIQQILTNLIQFLCDRPIVNTDLPESVNEKISLLINCLRSSRCLVVLDNIESLLCDESRAGICSEEHQQYGELFQRVGESTHQSCVLLTTREKPKEVAFLEGESFPVRSLQLDGFEEKEGEKILQQKGLSGTEAELAELVKHYNGNPLALKIAGTTIRDLFEGNVAEFLRQDTAIFGDIRDVLTQQFQRLLNVEKKLVYWLAINREPITLEQLQEDLVDYAIQIELLDGLESLSRRCLIDKVESTATETGDVRFTLQSVVMEYVTNRLIEAVCQEIVTQHPSLFRLYALVKATAKDYIKETQIRLILQPIIMRLLDVLGCQRNIEEQLNQIKVTLQKTSPLQPGYTAGNILNLLCYLGTDLKGSDFSNLCVWQADLRNAILHDVNFQNADLAKSVFVETFGGVLSVAFSPDGTLLATGDTKGEIRLRKVADGQQMLICKGHNNWVTSVAFSPNGKMLASGSTDYTVKLWNVVTGQCLHTLQEHENEIWSVAFSPDGNMLASGSDDHTVKLWNVSTGECLRTFLGHKSWIPCAAFSCDGQILASGSNDNTVKLWDINTGECLKIFEGHCNAIRSITFSPSNKTLASSSEDQTVKLWDIDTGKCLKTFHRHSSEVYSVAFSPQGDFIVSGSFDQTVRLWDIDTGECLKTFYGHTGWVFSVAFSPQGDFIVSGSFDQTVRLWDIDTGECLRTFQGYTNQVLSVAFSPDDQTLASGSHDFSVRFWDVSTGQALQTLPGHSAAVRSVAFSPDGQILASSSDDRTVRLWDVITGQALQTFSGHGAAVWSVAFSPDGQILASSSDDRTVRLWDVSTGQALQTFSGHGAAVWSVAFSPDGQTLASGALDHKIRLWNVSTSKLKRTLEGHNNWVLSVAFSSDSELLSSSSYDGTIKLWRVSTGECCKTLQENTGWLKSITFSPDNRTLASGSHDYTIRLWDVSKGKYFRTLQGHTGRLWSVAFSPDNQILASSGDDETIRLWNVITGECLKTLKAEKPYERINLKGVTGLTEATIATLKVLGANDN